MTETLERFQTTEVGRVVQGLPPEGFIVGGLKGLAGLGSTERVAAKSAIRGFDQLLPAVTQGTANAASYAKLKIDLKTTQSANAIVESLKSSGKLPPHYMSKAQAAKQGWQPGKALNNSIPGAQIGGDVFNNSPPIKGLPQEASRIWREADIGISSSMSRSNQPGTRILYSDDGLLYITSDHYNSVTSIGRWKN